MNKRESNSKRRRVILRASGQPNNGKSTSRRLPTGDRGIERVKVMTRLGKCVTPYRLRQGFFFLPAAAWNEVAA